MPARPDLTDSQIKDIAAVLRNLRTTGRDPGRNRPATIVVGDAAQGQTYFGATCAKCHSATGDLKGLGDEVSRAPHAAAGVAGRNGGRRPRRGSRRARRRPLITVTLPSGRSGQG